MNYKMDGRVLMPAALGVVLLAKTLGKLLFLNKSGFYTNTQCGKGGEIRNPIAWLWSPASYH